MTILFAGLAAVLVVSSLMVILHKNPVTSALFLVLAFCSLAGIYLTLQAEFIGMVQVIVYAGAIMVLFLFVIMYLNLGRDAETGIQIAVRRGLGWIVGAVMLAEGVVMFGRRWGLGPVTPGPSRPPAGNPGPGEGAAGEHGDPGGSEGPRRQAASDPRGGGGRRARARPGRRRRARGAGLGGRERSAVIPASWSLLLSAVVFTIGVIGVLVRRNAIVIFMSVELMLNSGNLAFVAFARQLNSLDGQVFVFFVMTVAAAEVAVGLAIIVNLFRLRESVFVDEINLLKG